MLQLSKTFDGPVTVDQSDSPSQVFPRPDSSLTYVATVNWQRWQVGHSLHTSYDTFDNEENNTWTWTF